MAHNGNRIDIEVIDGPGSAGRLMRSTRRHGNCPHTRPDALRAAIAEGMLP